MGPKRRPPKGFTARVERTLIFGISGSTVDTLLCRPTLIQTKLQVTYGLRSICDALATAQQQYIP